MSSSIKDVRRISDYYSLIKQSLQGVEFDFTQGSIRKAVIMLAIPMMIEMIMESVFALVDLYFVGHLKDSSFAIQTVGLTESVLTILYSVAIGMSMAATALVARRTGEKNSDEAAHTGAQAIIVAIIITFVPSCLGIIYAKDILLLMGSSETVAEQGKSFTAIMMGSGFVVMLLFLINGIFRGAGNAAIAMKSLMVANTCNILLCPLLINGWGPVPAFGLTGAAMATAAGRGIGVLYQCYHLFFGKGMLRLLKRHFHLSLSIIRSLIKIATPGIFQFVIASCSWIVLARIVATTGGETGSAGYQTALRLMMFFLLPAWGLSNAAATLVGQSLGADNPHRAEESVMRTVKYNVLYMLFVSVIFFSLSHWVAGFFTEEESVRSEANIAMNILATGFVFYGVGMVMINAFNGAGDTWTPTFVNFIGFWLFQIPLAYLLAGYFNLEEKGVYIAIPVSETAIAIASFILFKRGRWKTKKV